MIVDEVAGVPAVGGLNLVILPVLLAGLSDFCLVGFVYYYSSSLGGYTTGSGGGWCFSSYVT